MNGGLNNNKNHLPNPLLKTTETKNTINFFFFFFTFNAHVVTSTAFNDFLSAVTDAKLSIG